MFQQGIRYCFLKQFVISLSVVFVSFYSIAQNTSNTSPPSETNQPENSNPSTNNSDSQSPDSQDQETNEDKSEKIPNSEKTPNTVQQISNQIDKQSNNTPKNNESSSKQKDEDTDSTSKNDESSSQEKALEQKQDQPVAKKPIRPMPTNYSEDNIFPSQPMVDSIEDASSEKFSGFISPTEMDKKRKHRLSLNGNFLPLFVVSGNKSMALDVDVTYGYSPNILEIGPFLSLDMDLDYHYLNSSDVRITVGGFVEMLLFQNSTDSGFVPSLGLKLGYGRTERNSFILMPYFVTKFFLTYSTAIFIDVKPFWLFLFDGRGTRYGVDSGFGFAHYFF